MHNDCRYYDVDRAGNSSAVAFANQIPSTDPRSVTAALLMSAPGTSELGSHGAQLTLSWGDAQLTPPVDYAPGNITNWQLGVDGVVDDKTVTVVTSAGIVSSTLNMCWVFVASATWAELARVGSDSEPLRRQARSGSARRQSFDRARAAELLRAWCEADTDEQHETWVHLKATLDQNRSSERKLFR